MALNDSWAALAGRSFSFLLFWECLVSKVSFVFFTEKRRRRISLGFRPCCTHHPFRAPVLDVADARARPFFLSLHEVGCCIQRRARLIVASNEYPSPCAPCGCPSQKESPAAREGRQGFVSYTTCGQLRRPGNHRLWSRQIHRHGSHWVWNFPRWAVDRRSQRCRGKIPLPWHRCQSCRRIGWSRWGRGIP